MTCDRVAIWRVRITRLCPYDVLHSMEVQSGWCRHDAVAVNSDCWDLGSGCGLILGRQAAWRPGTIGMVSSSLLAALCKQLLCLTVIARYLGSGYGLILGRQAAWRPGTIGMVSSSLLAALCKQLLCLKVIARYLGSDCGLILGRQAAWRPGSIGMVSSSLVGGTVQAVAVFKSNCEVLGLWLRAHTRSSSCVAAGYNRDGVVRLVGGVMQAVAVQ